MNLLSTTMKTEELKLLIERYYEGKTSEEEELILKNFFKGDSSPGDFEAEKEIFGYYSQLEEIRKPPDGLTGRIMEAVDGSKSGSESYKRGKSILYILSTAAALLILAGSYFFFTHRDEPADTFAEPETAYAETMKILYNVSVRLNKGTLALKPLSTINEAGTLSFRAINRSTIRIEENMNHLENILRVMDNIDQLQIDK